MRKKPSKTEQYLSPKQAAAETSLNPWTIRRMCYSGRIASVKCGRRLLVPHSELIRVLAEGYRPASEAKL